MTVRSMYVYNGSSWDEVGYTIAHGVPAGGASGAILSKSSATDYDTAWLAQSALTIAQSQVTNLTTDLSAKAPLASPTFTGTPAAPTAAVDTNTTQVATTAFTVAQIADDAVLKSVADAAGDLVVGSAADTFGKLALGTDNYALTVNTAGSGVAKVGWEDPTANPLTTAAMALKVNTATVGNLLTANQASVETDTTGFFTIDCTITATTDAALHGSKSLRMAATAAAAAIYTPGANTSGQPVTAGTTYTATASVKSSGTARSAYIRIYWYTAAGSPVSQVSSATVTTSTSAWTRYLVTAVAPATAAFAAILVYTEGNTVSDVHYIDCLGFWQGAGGDWALPGTPITNLGFYTDESCGRRLFQYDANNSRWQQTFGDTGWRDVTSTIDATHAAANANAKAYVRRINNTVRFAYAQNGDSGTTGIQTIWTAPSGFAQSATTVATTAAAVTSLSSGVPIPGEYLNATTTVVRSAGWTAVAHQGRLDYDTVAAWPTTLPGSAVGSIPA